MGRRITLLGLVLALLVMPIAPVAAATGEDVGTATTSLDILRLDIDGVPGAGLLDLDVGSLLSYASTDTDAERNALGGGEPFALSQLLLAGSQEFTARSDGSQTAGGESAALPGGLGGVTVGEMSAIVADGEARSVIEALDASLAGATALAGLDVGLPGSGSESVADEVGSFAQNGAVLSDLALDLGDILPTEVLRDLDLGSLLGLLGDLGLTDLELDAIVGQLEDLLSGITAQVGELDDIFDTLDVGSLGELVAEIDALVDEIAGLEGDIAGLEGDIADLEGDIADLEGVIDGLEGALAEIVGDSLDLDEAKALLESGICALPLAPAVCDDLDDFTELSDLLDAANLELDGLTEDLDVLQGLLDALQLELDGLIGDLDVLQGLLDTIMGVIGVLTGLLDSLLELVTDLLDTVLDLIDGIVGTDLLAVDSLTLGVLSAAGQDAQATALCDAGGVQVLGVGVVDDGCGPLKSALSGLPASLTGLLNNLPIVGGTLDGVVHVGGLDIIEELGTDGDFQVARAAVTPLELGIDLGGLSLGDGAIDGDLLGVVGDLTTQLGLLDGLLGSSSAASQGAQAQGVEAQSAEAQQVEGIGDIGAITGLLDGLLGDLGGLGLPSLELAGPGLDSVANFGAADGTTTPISVVEDDPKPEGKLPVTGGGLALLVLGALLLAGGGTTLWMRRLRAQ